MRRFGYLILLLIPLAMLQSRLWAESPDQSDPDSLIARILSVDQEQRAQIKDVIFDAEYIEKETGDGTESKEKVRLVKRIYIKNFPDTSWYHEDFLQYFQEGKLKSQDDLRKESADRKEKKRRRGALDISFPILRAFTPERRGLYNIEYKGIAAEQIGGRACHHFVVTAKEPADSLINGDYYFETEGLHLARIDFSPSKLVHRAMFKMSEFHMALIYQPNSGDLWFPSEFDIQFKAKAMWVIGVKVQGVEYYRSPIVNTGISESLFLSDRLQKDQ